MPVSAGHPKVWSFLYLFPGTLLKGWYLPFGTRSFSKTDCNEGHQNEKNGIETENVPENVISFVSLFMSSPKVKDIQGHPSSQIRHRFRKLVAEHGGDISFSSFVKWLLSKVSGIIIMAIMTSLSLYISGSQRFFFWIS